jgi:diguanylate cyclase (GGDEF)-like protein
VTFLLAVRALVFAVVWPLAAYAVQFAAPDSVSSWRPFLDLLNPLLMGIGFLLAALFAQWRLVAAMMLITGAAIGMEILPDPDIALSLAAISLGLLPWFRDNGLFSTATGFAATIILVTAGIMLRGGTPMQVVDQILHQPFHITALPVTLSCSTLFFGMALTAQFIRTVVLHTAADSALLGVLLAMAGSLSTPWQLSDSLLLTACMLSIFTGCLLQAWRLAFLDQLTGLPNRRALDLALRATGNQWSIAMVDIDHFKQFNDKWGHDVGDQVLKRVASLLATVGGGGRAYRYGGEEFSVLFRHADVDRAESAMEAIRCKISDAPFQVRGERTSAKQRGKGRKSGKAETITVSAGIAVGTNPAADSVKRADSALYKAKRKGRNRIVRAG